ncbi:MAG: TA system VapC family ribonuclease toxin [Spirochaetales bacterium]
MILVDANLLVYAAVQEMPQHEAAKAWLDQKLNGYAPVGLPWASLLGFVRLTTNPRVFSQPLSLADSWAIVRGWLDCPKVWIPLEAADHAAVLGHLLPFAEPGANLVPDLSLAALALANGLTLCSTDADFARFTPIKWENPLR